MSDELHRSPLDAIHRRLGAKMGAFAGWDMPIQYQGTMSEHQAVRSSVGVFDLSHLGKVEVRGEGAHDALQHALSNDLDRLTEPGAAQYTLCLTDDGGIVDDLIVYREADGYLLVPNAANWPKVADAVRASDRGRTEVTPRPDIAVLAVQGPRAPELVGGLFPEAADLPYMHLAATGYRDAPARVCRTGYTGERGFELLVDGEVAPALWEELFERGAPFQVTPRPDIAVLAVQGPRAPELVGGLFPEAADLPYMHLAATGYRDAPARVCRTGYTGERGFELLVDGEVAPALWEELFERGAPFQVTPVGLGGRDTLRLEMGYALHGNDISTDTDPFEARLGWAVAMGKDDFRGREALAARKEAGPKRQLAGLLSADRLIPRHGMAVYDGDRPVGEVTSGTFSPTLRQGIALAYVHPDVAAKGTELQVDVRGRRGAVTVTRPPFVDASPK